MEFQVTAMITVPVRDVCHHSGGFLLNNQPVSGYGPNRSYARQFRFAFSTDTATLVWSAFLGAISVMGLGN